ncbi:MAG: DegT/DnrJ/EryC1/StrS family aminotransferase [Glycomyces artemisiae]|uniref:DegT/DnrJ/EryC1/StrS family aminotransferase n=1 Tax=Glycomyces artemisiae TaxID=1076443 RepID=A0A850BYU1_9ACTN|nr:DegT/DnrJ/EryC1/StrS family aminotransferase [Glycomyces artemisiae]
MIDRAPTQCEVQTVPENAERHVPDQQREFIPPAKPHIGEAEIEAAVAVLRSGRVVQGPEVAAFEEEFAKVSGTAECVAVNSGTSALQLALLAMGIGPGDEVIVPSFSFAASANAVRLVGAEPVFADIEPGTFCVDPAHVEALVGPKTAAIMPVHLYGHPADMTRLTALAERRSLAILEDACQAHGAQVEGRPVGSFGAAGTFSFYPTKNMHALEGGMVSTDDPKLARTLRLLRNQGMEVRYQNEIVGANMRMTDVSAAIGRVQLTRLGEWTEQRRANAAHLDKGLAGAAGVVVPPVAPWARHIYHQYTVRVPEGRDAALEQLNAAGVGSAVYYPVPIHKLAPYAHIEADLPETDRAAAEVLSLPIHPALSEGDLDRIVEAVHSLELAQ